MDINFVYAGNCRHYSQEREATGIGHQTQMKCRNNARFGQKQPVASNVIEEIKIVLYSGVIVLVPSWPL
ncbi:hypothetical protein HanPI659440_Chr16g0657041 [Helianthus annuus]|nr:hypothetical protein HanPI659440_Chr16g0657041 [Helianthus annuus]